MESEKISISQAANDFINLIQMSRSANTARSYSNALKGFFAVLDRNGIDPENTPANKINEDAISWLLNYLKIYSPATEQLYTIAVTRFFQYLMAEDLANINHQRMQLIVRTRSRRAGQRLPQFPKEDIEDVIKYADEFPTYNYENFSDLLISYRDAALIKTLADTGMRVHELCNLRRGDLDWNEYKAIIIGKGDRQAIIRFSSRSIISIKKYLDARKELDGRTGKPLSSLPILARHDRGTGTKIQPITPTTARNIIKRRVREALGEESSRIITPHSFRHYFVTNVLKGSGGNLKLAQELARHKNIQVTQRYAHLSDDELDKGYFEIFED